jgi:hypothetical protein
MGQIDEMAEPRMICERLLQHAAARALKQDRLEASLDLVKTLGYVLRRALQKEAVAGETRRRAPAMGADQIAVEQQRCGGRHWPNLCPRRSRRKVL